MPTTKTAADHDGRTCRNLTGMVNDALCVSCRRADRQCENGRLPVETISTWKAETTATGVILTINGRRYSTVAGESIADGLGRAARGLNGTYGAI